MTHSSSLTLELARFACQLTPDASPACWKRKVILHLMDSLGCGVAAREDQVLQMSAKLARSQYAPGNSVTLDGGSPLSSSGAAFLNAAAINALDYDDGFEVTGRGMGHPGATLVAGALAAIGAEPVRGKALLTALVAAWEINGRVILSQQPTPERFREVYGVCQHQSLGAAVAFGLLRGCDAWALENCLGLAASLTPLPSLHKYNWQQRPLISFKDYNAPAAEAGVRAVEMHLAGIIGPRDVLAGEQGFWRMMGSDQFKPGILTDNLGADWQLQHASFKAYPTCRWMHTALESFEGVLKEIASPEQIQQVRVYGSKLLADFFTDTRPESGTDAQFSLPLAIACLAFNIPRHQWSSEEVRTSARLLALADKVEVLAEAHFDQLMQQYRRPSARVEVVSGNVVVAGDTIDYPAGTQENPLSENKIIDKFIANLSTRMAAEKAEEIAARLLDLERCEDIGALIAPILD
jgi:2-methylcitrate dehydratase PrpD